MSAPQRYLHLLLASLLAPLPLNAAAQCTGTEDAVLYPSDPDFEGFFGNDIALDGDVIVAGEPGDNQLGTDAGAAYVYRFDGASWIEEQKLIDPATGALAHFGHSVGASGNFAVVGAWLENDPAPDSGSATLFEFDGTVWTPQRLSHADQSFGWFGRSADLDGQVAVVGAPQESYSIAQQGGVHVYRYDGASWNAEQILVASDAQPGDRLGMACAVQGNLVIAGALTDDVALNSGAVYIYRYNGASWTEEAKLIDPNGEAGFQFGGAVDIDGSVAVVGHANNGARRMLIFRDTGGGNWVLEDTITAPDGGTNFRFGFTVAVSGDRAATGDITDDTHGLGSGAAYTYRYAGGRWALEQKLTGSVLGDGDGLGAAVDVQGERTVGAASASNDLIGKGGAAYVYSTPSIIPYGFGNGDGAACPCGNEAAGCGGCENSAGVGAVLGASGSASVAASDLVLEVTGGVPNKLGLFFQGNDALGDGIGVPFQDGLLCTSGSIVRLQVMPLDGLGAARTSIDIPSSGAVVPGDVKRYQFWYRDLQGPCGNGSNLTNGLHVRWGP